QQGRQDLFQHQLDQAAQNFESLSRLRVSTPVYWTDGQVTNAAASGFDFKSPVYPYSRKTICETSSALPQLPTDAGFGWRVTITPRRSVSADMAAEIRYVGAANSTFDVTWLRLWVNGQKVNEPAHGPTQLSLSPG